MLRLLLIGDLHYPYVENPSAELIQAREAFYSRFLQRFLELEADWHISLGDLTNLGRPDELEYVFDHIFQSDRFFRHVLGNHDAYSLPKEQILAITGQQRYNAIETEEAYLVFLDTTKEMDHDDWGGELDEEQLAWLEKQVALSGEKPLLLFGHHPVYQTTARSHLDKLSIHPDIDVSSILAKKKGTGFYFCGHNHVHSIVQKDQWHYIQTAACLDQPGFRLVEVDENQIKVSFISMDDESILQQAPTIYNEMKHFTHTPDAQGKLSDREYIFTRL